MGLTVHVMVPGAREAESIVTQLQQHGMAAASCRDPLQLLNFANEDRLGPLLIAEESLNPALVHRLGEVLDRQPAWSDFPILILTTEGSHTNRSQLVEDYHPGLGSPILLERPIRTDILVSSVRAAVRARKRQYEMREALLARDTALAELRAERDTLRNSEARFRHLIENASVCINISDIYGHISYCNPTLLRLIGYSEDDLHRGLLRWDELTPPEFAEADKLATAQLIANGTCDPYQKAYRARDGRLIPLLVGMFMLPSAESDRPPEQVAVFLTDLTSQKLAENALLQSEKLAAVGRLAASISHEINNPLEAVINLFYLIQQEDGLPAVARQFLAMAELELARVSQIATQTLRFHREAAKPRQVDAEELIQSVLGLYRGRLSNSSINIICQNRGARPVTCFEGDIRQVLNNLVGNAVDCMRTGGRLILRTRNGTSWRTGTSGVRITVADTGHGMTAEVRARIFEAFYTTKGISGTGLGLWISKGIIDKHSGVLAVKSSNRSPRTGSVFSLFLPCELIQKLS